MKTDWNRGWVSKHILKRVDSGACGVMGDSLQAVELEPGVASGAFWHEARMLQRCSHDRIVPLHGVVIKVRLDQMVSR